MTRYEHTQVGYLTIVAMGAVLVIGAVGIVNDGVSWGPVIVLAIIAAAMVMFSSLTVTIRGDMLEVRFGPGPIRKRYDLKEIASAMVVRNPFYYGWGIRRTPHGWLYNVSGFNAVEVEFDTGRKLRIGTDEPDRLETALTDSIAAVRKKKR